MSAPGILAHRVDGQGEPLLLLNGGMMSYAAWDDFVPPLAERFRLVRCDFRGQLRSPGEPPATFDGHAEDLVALLDHLGIVRAHVVGTSFGGFAAIHLAANAPDRVASLSALTVTDRISEAMLFEARALVVHLPDAWFSGLAGLLGALEGLDLTALLPRISCPALVLLADGDSAMPLPRGRALAKALPRGELVVVEGAGHAVVVEKPAETLHHLLAFLARTPLAREAPAQRIERDGGTS